MIRRATVIVLLALSAMAAFGAAAQAASDDVGARIVGGTTAPAGAWPSFAQLTVRMGGSYNLCGGSLITPTVVLTAAHCVNGATVASSNARIGTTTINTGTPIAWSRAAMHPNFDPVTLDYDIALVELASASAAPRMPLIPPVAEPLLVPNTMLKVAGFGLTSTGGSISSTLLEVSLPLVADATCSSAYVGAGYTGYTTTNMLCAGTSSTDSCNGDSGGSLTLGVQGVAYSMGLVSWGPNSGCAVPGLPGVYTRVSAFRSWVRTHAYVASWVASQTATADITSVTSTGSTVTASWNVSGGNWMTTGFQSTVNGDTITGTAFSRSVDLPAGGPVTIDVTPTVTTGAVTSDAWSGTPTPTRAPVVTAAIDGAVSAGVTLTATVTADDPWAAAPTFQWSRDGAAISGATGQTYVVTDADVGHRVSVTVRVANAAGVGEASASLGTTPTTTSSSSSTPVPSPTPAPETRTAPAFARSTVLVHGIRRVGARLSVTAPPVSGSPAPKVTYQWLRSGKAIKGKTKRTYVVQKADRGTRITCRITAKNAMGTKRIVSRPARIPR